MKNRFLLSLHTNKSKIIYTVFIVNLYVSNGLSQKSFVSPNQISKEKVTTISVPRGNKSLMPSPSDDSERIKYRIKVEKDSAFYSLKADLIEKGVVVDEKSVAAGGVYDPIVFKTKVYKGNEIVFEMIPDVSKPDLMTLYTCFPGGMMSFRYLINRDRNKQIKYKKFEAINQLKNSRMPLLLCYIDDEQNHTELFLEKFLKNNLISITSNEELQEKILQHIERGLFVHYDLNSK